MSDEKSQWTAVTEIMDREEISLGRYLGYWFEKTPRRALHYASYYKFAAKMIGKGKRVLDVGCSEGLGTWTLAVECGAAKGVDLDEAAIAVARQNWQDPRIDFACADFLTLPSEQWQAVVSFDVVEHILPENVATFFTGVSRNLTADGVAIIGTPSLEGQHYASEVSRAGHVNLYTYERLEEEMLNHFRHVFMFCANDEMVHTGFPRLAHYLIAVGCGKRTEV